jgi:putative endonuclease
MSASAFARSSRGSAGSRCRDGLGASRTFHRRPGVASGGVTAGFRPQAHAQSDRPARSQDARRALGRRGEELACAHLEQLGLRVLERNARTRHGEIDLIAFDGDTLVFAEVKTRGLGGSSSQLDPEQRPLAALRPRQRARLRRLAAAWLHEQRGRPTARTIRFDAIGVVVDGGGALYTLEHIEGAW